MCLEKEIIRSIKEQSLEGAVHFFDKKEADIITNKLKGIFVKGNPRAWWLSLKYNPEKFIFDEPNSFERINEFFNSNEEVWWIIENEEELLFKTSIKHIILIIADCPFFEYNIVSLDNKKILIENDHNEFLFINLDNYEGKAIFQI